MNFNRACKAVSFTSLLIILALTVGWTYRSDDAPLTTQAITFCDAVFYSIGDGANSNMTLKGTYVSTVGRDCGAKQEYYFTLASNVDWSPDLSGTFYIKISASGAGSRCTSNWLASGSTSQKTLQTYTDTANNCFFSASTGNYYGQAYVSYKKTSTGSQTSVAASEMVAYR